MYIYNVLINILYVYYKNTKSHLLPHVSDLVPQPLQVEVPQVHTVELNAALDRIVEAKQLTQSKYTETSETSERESL